MKLLKVSLLSLTVSFAINSEARVLALKNCTANLAKEVFSVCPDGEAGAPTVCGSKTTELGVLHLNMVLNSDSNSYT